MTTFEDFFGSAGRRRNPPAVPPYPHANPDTTPTSSSTGRVRKFVVRALLVLLLLLAIFLARFIPESWNPFASTGLASSDQALNGSSGNGGGGLLSGSTATPVPGSPGANGRDGVAGSPGARGADGTNGRNGVDGANGADGAMGPAGQAGPPGSLGQANSDISACDDNIVVGLRSGWDPGDGSFHVSRILLTDVSDACNGLYLGFDLLDSSGASLAHVEVNSLVVVNSAVTLSAADFPAFTSVRSVEVARVALEIAS